MIRDLKPYPAYKESGVPWLGQVPEHWEVVPLGRMGRLFKGNGGTKSDEVASGVPCVRYGDLYTTHEFFITRTRTFVPEELSSEYTSIQYGDVLFAASGETIDDIGRSAVNLISTKACCGGDVIVFRPSRHFEARFIGYASDCPSSKYQKACMGLGFTVIHIYADQLKYLMMTIPLTFEQEAIVRFLDHIDSRIRRYIRAKQKLISLLEQQKQAAIQNAVTSGLDSNVLLKPSDIAWLGDIPKHWETVSLGKASISIQTGPFGSQLHANEYISDGVPVINPSHLRRGHVVADRAVSVAAKKADELSRHKLMPGDIVVARRGELGRCALVTDEQAGWLCGTGSLRIRPKPALFESAYLTELLGSPGVRDTLYMSSIGATMDNLNAGMIARLWLPRPPVIEQRQIIRFVSDRSSSIEHAKRTAFGEINLAHEYRTRLIVDVVTGKLDVREVAASLPDEVEGPDDLHLADDAELLPVELAEEE